MNCACRPMPASLISAIPPRSAVRPSPWWTSIWIFLVALDPPLFIEAGARGAAVSFRVRKLLPRLRASSPSRPNPYNIEHYRREVRLRQETCRIRALGACRCARELSVLCPQVRRRRQPADGDRSELAAQAHGAEYRFMKSSRSKPSASTTTFHRPKRRIAVIWIDVEGSTGNVLTGGRRLLGQTQVLMIEVEDRPLWQRPVARWTSARVPLPAWPRSGRPRLRMVAEQLQHRLRP